MSDLDELKKLLFGAEKDALDSIAERVESRDVRAADVADVLPEAIHRSHRRDGELVESLTDPVGECLQQAFRDDPETYGDALYPVMGPAIRKSIMHALRGFAQQINEAVEHSVSPKGLKWRWQASRAGVPFGEYVLQKTLLYRVEQAYLISRDNGLLMGHVHHEASKIKDSDAVSAMFTAIQDFVKESFSPDRTGRLESADMGDFTLWAVHGPHALLVCVIRGVPPRSLRGELSAILERIHFRYSDAIKTYKGDTSSVPEIESELVRCLRFQAHYDDGDAAAESGRGRRIIGILLLLALIGVLGWLYWQSAKLQRQHDSFAAALEATPGIYAEQVARDGKRYSVRGLRDPLASTVADVAATVGIDAERLRVSMQPFQSLAPEIVDARIARAIDWPAGVRYEVIGSTLVVSGEAPRQWHAELADAYRGIAGVDTLDASGLTSERALPPTAAVEALDGRRFFFTNGTAFAPGGEAALREYADALLAAGRQADAVGYRIRVSLVGSADRSGDTATNARLAQSRAAAVAAVLAASGIDVDELRGAVADDATPAVDASQRYVIVGLELEEHSPAR